jgi:hypothetical protein
MKMEMKMKLMLAVLLVGAYCCHAQLCGIQGDGMECPNNQCCGPNGYCGVTATHCGVGCQSGPCCADILCGSRAAGRPCPNNMCCSSRGTCGFGSIYCGEAGCQSGPCDGNRACSWSKPCPNNWCCNVDGWCGIGPDYCGSRGGKPCLSGTCCKAPIASPATAFLQLHHGDE